MTKIRHHIIHDTDRDGFGSAAMLAASLGAERCKLYPSAEKDGLALLAKVSPGPGDIIWILDIPTPASWEGVSVGEDLQVNWVDHHPVRASQSPPESVRLYLPVDDRPVTTMHILVAHGLVPNLPEPMRFVHALCFPKKAVGHPYAAFTNVPKDRVEEALSALLADLNNTYLQNIRLEQVIGWAERIDRDLHDLVRRRDVPVFFRPGASGISMVGLTAERPQRGKSGITNLNKLRENFEEQFQIHCIRIDQGRETPEKQLQSFLLRSAICGSAERWIAPLNKASSETATPVKLRFATDEIPLPYNGGKIVCDILAVRQTPTGNVPVVIELKSGREMKRLIEQVTAYAALVDRHRELFRRLFSVLLRENIKLNGPCEKWIVWPMAGEAHDPREEQLAKHGIRVVGYEVRGQEFRFRVGQTNSR